MTVNNGNMLTVWNDYCDFFSVKDWRTAERRLVELGFGKPKRGAPKILRETLIQRVNRHCQK